MNNKESYISNLMWVFIKEFIDSDASGMISFDEFLNWVHPDRELQMLEKTHGDKGAVE